MNSTIKEMYGVRETPNFNFEICTSLDNSYTLLVETLNERALLFSNGEIIYYNRINKDAFFSDIKTYDELGYNLKYSGSTKIFSYSIKSEDVKFFVKKGCLFEDVNKPLLTLCYKSNILGEGDFSIENTVLFLSIDILIDPRYNTLKKKVIDGYLEEYLKMGVKIEIVTSEYIEENVFSTSKIDFNFNSIQNLEDYLTEVPILLNQDLDHLPIYKKYEYFNETHSLVLVDDTNKDYLIDIELPF